MLWRIWHVHGARGTLHIARGYTVARGKLCVVSCCCTLCRRSRSAATHTGRTAAHTAHAAHAAVGTDGGMHSENGRSGFWVGSDWAHPCHIGLHRDWAHPCHICTGTGLTPATSVCTRLGSPPQRCNPSVLSCPSSQSDGLLQVGLGVLQVQRSEQEAQRVLLQVQIAQTAERLPAEC
jgi:hypothetical protein